MEEWGLRALREETQGGELGEGRLQPRPQPPAHRDGKPLTERGSAAKAATLRRISFSLPRRGMSDTLPSRTSGMVRATREGSEGHTRPSCWGEGQELGSGLSAGPPALPGNASSCDLR